MKKPNIIFIMSDDHAANAISCYNGKINETPNIDRIANEGMRLDNCFCVNSICAPSRATILTGTHSHINGVKNIGDKIDGRMQNFPKLLQKNNYQTAVIGKWHLGHGGISDPTGFDYWNVLIDQGFYNNPEMIENGKKRVYNGYVTNIITDLCIEWLKNRDKERPFCLLCHHKAPHRPWIPDDKYKNLYEDIEIPRPETFNDTYENRASAARAATMRIERDLYKRDLKMDPPSGLTPEELKNWKYQMYIKDYLRCVVSIDDSVGEILKYLDEEKLTEDCIVVYTSDQGFFLGEHGWYDKRFMYEESIRMPLIVRYPREIKPGTVSDEIISNLDFAQTFLDYAGVDIPEQMQGDSIRPILRGEKLENWKEAIYYRYWMYPSQHNVFPHYGIRTKRYKLIYYYPAGAAMEEDMETLDEPEWELFDLEKDPFEMCNVYNDPTYSKVVKALKEELYRLKRETKDFD